MIKVIVSPGEDEYWIVECTSLPGCITQGKIKEEAISNINEAIDGYNLALNDDGIPVPEEAFASVVITM